MPRRNRRSYDKSLTLQGSTFYINGYNFSDEEEFYDEIEKVLIPGERWGRNIDALRDILRWPCPTEIHAPYTLVWLNSEVSRQCLNHTQMAEWLRGVLEDCHPTGLPYIWARLMNALDGEGPTMFDFLVENIESQSKYVRLILS